MKSVMSLLMLVGLAALSACGDEVASDTGVVSFEDDAPVNDDEPEDNDDKSEDGFEDAVEQLVLEALPRPSAFFWGEVEEVIALDTGVSEIVAEAYVPLALGEGYAQEVRLPLNNPPVDHQVCRGTFNGDIVVQEASIQDDQAGAEVYIQDGQVTARLEEPGVYIVEVIGLYTPSETLQPRCREMIEGAGRDRVRFLLELDVRLIAGVKITLPERCRDAQTPRVVSTTSLRDFVFEPLDTEGEVFRPSNAQSGRDVRVTIRTTGAVAFEATATEVSSFTSLQIPAGEGRMLIEGDDGRGVVLDVVSPERLSVPEVSFWVAGHGEAQDQNSYDMTSVRTRPFVVAPAIDALTVNGEATCSTPGQWFELTSATPEVCEVVMYSRETPMVEGFPVGGMAPIRSSGTCSLTLRGDHFAQGAGFSESVSVHLENVAP